jgi:hydrogenase/urease accessory protein HupE
MIRSLILMCLLALFTVEATAHEVRPALLKISEVSDNKYLVHWKVPAMGGQRLAIDPEFESDFIVADDRIGGFNAGASVRSWYISGRSLADSTIKFTNLSSTMIDVLVQVTFLDGRYHMGLVTPSNPAFHIPARDDHPTVFGNYVVLGIEHILSGWDHLLFVLGMTLLVSNYRRLLKAITGFTFAHSITLALAALDIIYVPSPPVEATIALSILFLAVEVARYHETKVETLAVRSPWSISVAFGLVHGLGFAGALSEYGLPAYARITSLMAFNVGVECGQVMFIAVIVAISALASGLRVPHRPALRMATNWFVGICGSFWLVERLYSFMP